MHIVYRESHGLEEVETPMDLGQDPADLVILSYSDSDLGAFAAGWHRGRETLPSLRLANLVALRHPLSVDTYVERTLCKARGILVRIIGGESYWAYGLTTLNALARRRGIALAVLPADGRDDERLDMLSTVPVSTLRQLKMLCDAGGAVAAHAALCQLSLASGLDPGVFAGTPLIENFGFYAPNLGPIASPPESDGRPRALVTFYRSYLTAADTAPLDALMRALDDAGFQAYGAFMPSLKAPGVGHWLATHCQATPPAIIVNATAFSAKAADGTTPFDAAGCPVFQVALSTARRRDWTQSLRGLSPADLAMHVVLPEVDGRLFSGVISFKSPQRKDPDLQFSHFAHRPDPLLIDACAQRLSAWQRLARTPAHEKDLAIVLSSYPGKPHQIAHAVGLDALASTEALLLDLAGEGYRVAGDFVGLGQALSRARLTWSVHEYSERFAALPASLRADLTAAWGDPQSDPLVREGAFHFAALRRGRCVIAIQPERGHVGSRDADYHDLSRTPRHAYVAFYLWLQSLRLHALVHMGAHGTLEWLPGKSVALSQTCWPDVLVGATPVIYPFIVNDPGEAAQAKRRIGAVTIGHLPPPLAMSHLPEGLARLERLLDEYSTAEGLDPARRHRLIAAIRSEAQAAGVEDDLGICAGASPAEAIPRIDRFVCDVKESQYGEGLHVLGHGACASHERAAMLAALRGQRVAPGPAGSPYRGRIDVLPTGRNLYAVDPRAVPTRAAHAQGIKLAEELLRRHLQDHGEWPKGLVVDLWGSASMRTAGEDFAMALHLAGLAPLWRENSDHVTGFEIIPLALLNRPRIDVTLRVSGLFRDVFPGLAQIFEAGAAALSKRDWEAEDNPYRQRIARVFGPQPGHYGAGMGSLMDTFTPQARAAAGNAWLASSSWAIGADGMSTLDRSALETRVKAADAFVHMQDLPETDLLLAADYAVHEGGFAAAAALVGAQPPALYHLDGTRPQTPRARTLPEEIARVVRARAANPKWIAGMMPHGFRGAAEIAATLDHLAAFAQLTQSVPAHLFDLYYDATFGHDDVRAFLITENPAAFSAMQQCFQRLNESGLWQTRRNSISAALREAS